MEDEVAQQLTEETTDTILQQIFHLYTQFVSVFPAEYQWIISLVVVLAVASFLWNLIRKNLVWIVLAIVIFPGILPVLKNLFDSLTKMIIGV